MTRFIHIALIFLFSSQVAWSQGTAAEANLKIKSMFVYNFVKNVDWPSSAKEGDFKIGILADKKLYQLMNSTYAGKEINGQKLVFEFYDSFGAMSKCQILYVAPEVSKDLSKNSSKLRANKTLVVSDSGGLLYDGSVINFIINNNKLAFEISKTNADLVPLTIGPALLKMAASVI